MTSAHVWYDFMLHHHTAAPCGCGQHDPSEHSAHFARTNWDATLHPAQISLNLKLPDVREHCSLTFSGAVGPQGALVLPLKVPWRFLLSLCRFLLALVPAGNESNLDSWLMFCRRGWWNAGSLHSEEQISPNETPCLIRAADTDNAVTGAGAIYLGLMSTDKSARWDCGFGQLNPQTAHYRQVHCHYFGLQQISRSAFMHIMHTKCNFRRWGNYSGVYANDMTLALLARTRAAAVKAVFEQCIITTNLINPKGLILSHQTEWWVSLDHRAPESQNRVLNQKGKK